MTTARGAGTCSAPGPDAAHPTPGTQAVSHEGVLVRCTPELATTLRDALTRRPLTRLTRTGPEVPLTLDDQTVLAWLTHYVGGVLMVSGGPGPRIAG